MKSLSRLGKALPLFLAFGVLMPGGQLSSPIQRASLGRELEELKQRGLTYRFLDNTRIEIGELTTGFKRVKALQEPSEAEIHCTIA